MRSGPRSPSGGRASRGLPTLVLVVAVVLGACAPHPAGLAGPSGPAPVRGGQVVFAWQEPATLDPVRSTGSLTDATVQAALFGGLLRLDPEGRWAPSLAERVPTLANGDLAVAADGSQTVRYVLRRGLAWTDGTPLTSADVRFTWERYLKDPRASTREGYERITGVETPDARTAIVRYKTAYPAYAARFGAIVPRHLLEGASESTIVAFGRRPVGTGPFKLVEWLSADHLTLERAEAKAARPYLDRVIFRFMPSLEAAKLSLKAGEADVSPGLGETDLPDFDGTGGIRIESRPSPVVESLSFNLERPALRELAVRRALTLATPRAAIVAKLLGGKARVGSSEVPLGWAAPRPGPAGRDDPQAARSLLEGAGWRAGPDGIRAKGGVRLRLELTSTTGNPLRERIEQVIADAWQDVGVETVIRNVPNAALTGPFSANGVRKRGTFDVVLAQLGLGPSDDPQTYLARHRCDQIPREANAGAGGNWERWCDPEVDALLDQASATLDEGARRDLYGRLLERVNDAAVAVWLYDKGRHEALRSSIRGHLINPWMPATYDLDAWWLARS